MIPAAVSQIRVLFSATHVEIEAATVAGEGQTVTVDSERFRWPLRSPLPEQKVFEESAEIYAMLYECLNSACNPRTANCE